MDVNADKTVDNLDLNLMYQMAKNQRPSTPQKFRTSDYREIKLRRNSEKRHSSPFLLVDAYAREIYEYRKQQGLSDAEEDYIYELELSLERLQRNLEERRRP